MEAREIMILIFSIFTFISLIIVLYGHYMKSEDHTVAGYIALVAVGLVCWLLVGSVATVTKTPKEVNIRSITKGDFEIYVSVKEKNKLLVFDKVIDFESITDTTTFYEVQERNIYNITVDPYRWDYYHLVDGEEIYSNE